MDVYIIDTNIVFSAAMNANSEIGRFLIGASSKRIKFYAPNYLRDEINRHFERLVERAECSTSEVREQIEIVYDRIHFISDDQIPISYYSRAADYVREVDIDDVVFVALNDYLNAILWTGDSKLYRYLIKKGYERVINFVELKERYKE